MHYAQIPPPMEETYNDIRGKQFLVCYWSSCIIHYFTMNTASGSLNFSEHKEPKHFLAAADLIVHNLFLHADKNFFWKRSSYWSYYC